MARLGLALLLLLVQAPARAEVVRSEGEGAAPLAPAGSASPRSAALEAALRDAVERVAAELAGRGASGEADPALRAALGPEPARFAQGYRELGSFERPGPDGRELVVRVEARVDAGRLGDALRRAGLLAARVDPPRVEARGRVVVEPLPEWSTLAAVRRRLVELGARRVWPERADAGRVVLEIDADRSESSLVAALVASPPPGVSVTPIGDREGAPAIRLERTPEPLPAD